MAIYAGSRYERISYSVVTEADGTRKRFLNLRISPVYNPQQSYTMLPKDELDLLAYRYLGQSRQWWKFAEANDLFWPLDIPQGTIVKAL